MWKHKTLRSTKVAVGTETFQLDANGFADRSPESYDTAFRLAQSKGWADEQPPTAPEATAPAKKASKPAPAATRPASAPAATPEPEPEAQNKSKYQSKPFIGKAQTKAPKKSRKRKG